MQENKCFQKEYICMPINYLQDIKNKKEIKRLDSSDSIILPSSALEHLSKFDVKYPYFFRVQSKNLGLYHYCNVIEFTAEDRFVYVPGWIMQELFIGDTDRVYINSVTLQKGEKVKFKVDKNFLELDNPSVVLERKLRSLNTLSMNQILNIQFVGDTYKLEVIEISPDNIISIIDTNLKVEFELNK
jgi:ubiquitin fusion degradation protein 1